MVRARHRLNDEVSLGDEMGHLRGVAWSDTAASRRHLRSGRDHDPLIACLPRQAKGTFVGRTRIEGDLVTGRRGVERRLQVITGLHLHHATARFRRHAGTRPSGAQAMRFRAPASQPRRAQRSAAAVGDTPRSRRLRASIARCHGCDILVPGTRWPSSQSAICHTSVRAAASPVPWRSSVAQARERAPATRTQPSRRISGVAMSDREAADEHAAVLTATRVTGSDVNSHPDAGLGRRPRNNRGVVAAGHGAMLTRWPRMSSSATRLRVHSDEIDETAAC